MPNISYPDLDDIDPADRESSSTGTRIRRRARRARPSGPMSRRCCMPAPRRGEPHSSTGSSTIS